ncbi:helicase [Rhizobium leguminosarum]|uniref:Helicase n=1 Tax=Rhizobium leguminosarum TaxID=384 RepID=A0AAE2MHN6_RHILE|nr:MULTISPECIES: DEAD/DEAH box helicase [Rhizobium]MBB4289501.1 helicase [Rhizobium leguminosarum]MBB4294403.1 helicase [Rhizobium leguminosarum]MBB4305799.1 helicase [Rhizobium leguminosarum]MBB4418624.1 helicase [Rhizobium leguminosarum]MBB4433468.1 helicase [Rhizobium esperanzae]
MTLSDELRHADVTAFAMSRGLSVDPMSWGYLLAVAQQEINQFQSRKLLDTSLDLLDEQTASPLIAAARVCFEVAKRPVLNDDGSGPEHRLERTLLLLLSGCAYAMYGNFPSAAATHKLVDKTLLESDGLWLTFAVCNPAKIHEAVLSRHLTSESREFLERLHHFLHSGDESENAKLIRHFEELMVVQRPASEITMLRCARLALQQIVNTATSSLYRLDQHKPFHHYISRLIDDRRFCLLPPQRKLVFDDDLLDDDANCIVTLPTSAGKTLIAELVIASRMRKAGRVAVYVVPYIALGRQVLDTFRKHAPTEVGVLGYFGVFNSNDALPKDSYSIVVATPERLDGLLRNTNFYARLDTVVFDEAHGIENGVRGARLESLIVRMRLQQKKANTFRIVLLSAVLTDVRLLLNWLGPSARHYNDSWRPTSRRIGIWTSDGLLRWIFGGDPLRPPNKGAADYVGSKPLPVPQQVYPTDHFGGITAQKPATFGNAAYLARYIQSTIGGPILLACSSKANTRGLAAKIAENEAPIPRLETSLTVLELIHSEYPHLKPLAHMLARGVAYHNASLPAEIREAIEDAIKRRDLKYVASTTTLAEGVDLPFRSTIIFDWLTGYKDTQAPMHSLLFRNIAGRCGRAGEFTEGDTIIFDNVLGKSIFTSNQTRRAHQTKLFADPPPVASIFANDNLKPETRRAVTAVVASQLLASIPENPEVDDLEVQWAENSYAAQYSNSPQALLSSARAELLSEAHGEPFARAASPMQLTGLGEAANRSGFGPATCRTLLTFIARDDQPLSPSDFAADLIDALGTCDEQENEILRDIANRKKTPFFFKASDVSTVASSWLEGQNLTETFLNLPKAKESKATVSPADWALGERNSDSVSAQYDKFVDVTQYMFGTFVPWICRAIHSFRAYGTSRVQDTDWLTWAERFENSGAIDAIAGDLSDADAD